MAAAMLASLALIEVLPVRFPTHTLLAASLAPCVTLGARALNVGLPVRSLDRA